ncbi:MAG TPA: hypothetical protein VL242_43975 [Sorangium sp.]|uniref:hypothetical protein n=1 Tax=Sorangium sp. So ce1153 TaxID=3133333 RepID=UPI002BA11CB5|nr:hypothetical protein [Sorangium sp.]
MLELRTGLSLVAVLLGASWGRAAAAQPAAAREAGAAGAAVAGEESEGAELEAYRDLSRPPGTAARVVSTVAMGKGIRFNNPYRLQTQLGDTAESLSLTAGYLDFGAAFALGPADGVQHGAALRFSIAAGGVPQESLTPSYFVAYRGFKRALAYGRLGAAILIEPDVNVGGELAAGIGYFLLAGVALSGEIVGDLFYGAATYDAAYTVYPVVSAQLGLLIDHELLP